MSNENKDKRQSRKHNGRSGPVAKITAIMDFIQRRYDVRLNEVTNSLEVSQKGKNEFKRSPKFEANIALELLEKGFTSVRDCVSIFLGSDRVPSYHPVRDYFENLPQWDRKDWIKELSDCIGMGASQTEANEFRLHFKKHLLRCVASAFKPGYFNKHCFVLIGTGQSQGKTSFIRNLVPNALRSYITEAITDWKDKDSNIALGNNWFINLDELANLDRSETNSLKATLSRDFIKVRRPYDRVDSEIPRLANFWGSTNQLQFLNDLTGNVRWICFRIYSIDFAYSEKIDIDQLWAQCYELYRTAESHEVYELTRDEMKVNDVRNELYMVSSPELEAIRRFVHPTNKKETLPGLGESEFGQASEIMKYLNEKGCGLRNLTAFGKALQRAGFVQVSVRMKEKSNESMKGYWFFKHETNMNFIGGQDTDTELTEENPLDSISTSEK